MNTNWALRFRDMTKRNSREGIDPNSKPYCPMADSPRVNRIHRQIPEVIRKTTVPERMKVRLEHRYS